MSAGAPSCGDGGATSAKPKLPVRFFDSNPGFGDRCANACVGAGEPSWAEPILCNSRTFDFRGCPPGVFHPDFRSDHAGVAEPTNAEGLERKQSKSARRLAVREGCYAAALGACRAQSGLD